MKPIMNPETNSADSSALTAEAKLSFGAAGGCFVLGLIGYAVNALTTTETTLSAFLVISAFYLMLGVIGLLKGKSANTIDENNVLPSRRAICFEGDDNAKEAAA